VHGSLRERSLENGGGRENQPRQSFLKFKPMKVETLHFHQTKNNNDNLQSPSIF